MTIITGDYLTLEIMYRDTYNGGYNKRHAVVDFNDKDDNEEEWYQELFTRLDRWGEKAVEIKFHYNGGAGDEHTWTKVRG